ncbi:MAG: hypothetical protein KJO00_08335 [Bacteroidia bacterium]|nr:hypothetical protein [Bacteroidia bacterium]
MLLLLVIYSIRKFKHWLSVFQITRLSWWLVLLLIGIIPLILASYNIPGYDSAFEIRSYDIVQSIAT